MKVLRFIWNALLALILSAIVVLVLATALGLIVAHTWETAGLDDGNVSAAWLWIDGQPISYQDLGEPSDPCVVLVHGNYVEGSETWAANASALVKGGLRVVAVDLRGYGRSARDTAPLYSVRQQAELLATVLNNVQVQDATVVAHDWGSAVALQMTLDQPQFVQRLVLLAPRLEQDREPLWELALKTPYVRRAALWARYAGGPAETLERRALFANPALVTADYMSSVRAPTHVQGTLAALEAMAAAPADSDLPQALGQVQVPVLVLLGSDDPIVSADGVAAWTGRLPAAEVAIIEDAGHFPHVEKSTEVNRRILELSK